MNGLIVHDIPEVKHSTMILAFAGWPDAAEAATRAIRYMARKLPTKKIMEIDPEFYYDFTVNRPQTRVNRRKERIIKWPTNEFYSYIPQDDPQNGVLLYVGTEPNLKWKTFSKDQRKGKELDPRFFDRKEKQAFDAADWKEWRSFLETGAAIVIPPEEAAKVPPNRIFGQTARFVRTNKNKDEQAELTAKSRLVVPGHRDPDGGKAHDEGGFRTDAPTCPQLSLHILFSLAVRKRWGLRTFDVKTAFLSGQNHNRYIYIYAPTKRRVTRRTARQPYQDYQGCVWS